MNTRVKNIAALRKIAHQHGFAVAVTNSRRHGHVVAIRLYRTESDKGHVERAVRDYGSYVSRADLARLERWFSASE